MNKPKEQVKAGVRTYLSLIISIVALGIAIYGHTYVIVISDITANETPND